MKFNCVLSDTTLGGHKTLFGLLREQNDGSGQHIFIVPDRYTLGVEREICETMYPDGAFNVDVCSFTRLAQKALGQKNKACLSKEGTVLLLNRVIEERSSELIYYKNVSSVAFSREMFASIASLRSSGISADETEEKGRKIGGGLGDKLHDVALLYRAYEKALSENYFDTVTRVEWLINNVGKSDVTKNSHIYVLGFNVFSDRQLEFIKRAMLVCPSVSVSFCLSQKGSNGHCFPVEQREKLLSFAQAAGVPTSIRRTTEVLSPVFSFIHNEAFGKSRLTYPSDASQTVRIARYDNLYEEVKAIAREIVYLTREKDVRYRDIAIACNNDTYTPVLRKTFLRYGISYFIDEKYYIKNGFFPRFVQAVFAAADSDMDVRDVMKLVRHPYVGLSREEIQTFENYCVRYSVDHSLFRKTFDFEEDWVAEFVREKVTMRIEQVPKSGKIATYCELIGRWAEEADIIEKERDFLENGDREEKLYADKSKFLNVIEEIATLCGEQTTDAGGFADMVQAVTEDMTTGILPQHMDAVFIGNTSESRFNDVKILFVAGANDGYFPVTTGDKLIFGCYDTEVMKANGLPVFPSPEESNFFEQFAVIDLLSKPEKLYVSYEGTDENGEPVSEGNAVRELKFRLRLSEKPFEKCHDFTEEEKLAYRFATPENCYFEYTAGYVPKEYRESVRRFLVEEGYIKEEEEGETKYDLLRGYARTQEGEYKLSVSKMEKYFHCPFANYVFNVLSLQEKEEGGLKVNDKGTIIHEVLERYFRDASSLRTASEEERALRAEKCIAETFARPEYQRFKENYMTKCELESVEKECRLVCRILTDNMRHSAFTPTMLEKRFGDGGEISFTDGGEKFLFTGIVDRVDQNGDRIIIIDYKTGSIKEELKHVYDGKKIQLYLYLKYFIQKGYEIAGVFYLPISDGYKKEGVRYAMRGQMIGDIDTLYSLDDRAIDSRNDKYWSPNVEFGVETKGGERCLMGKNGKNYLQKEDFPMISEYVLRLVKQAIEEIREGEIAKKPVKDGCRYCPCAKICGDVPEREDVAVNAESFTMEDGGECDDTVE